MLFLADGDLVRQRGGDLLVDHQLGTRTFLSHDASFRHRARLRGYPIGFALAYGLLWLAFAHFIYRGFVPPPRLKALASGAAIERM